MSITEKPTELRTLIGHRSYVYSVDFSPTENILCSSGYDRKLFLWDTDSGMKIKELIGHKHWVLTCNFSRDGKTLTSGSYDKDVRVWSVKDGKTEVVSGTLGHKFEVRSVQFDSEGSNVLSGSSDGTVKLWNVEKKMLITTFLAQDRHSWDPPVLEIDLSRDDSLLACSHGRGGRCVRIWDFRSRKCVKRIVGHTGIVWTVKIDAENKYIASGSDDKEIHIVDLRMFRRYHTFSSHDLGVNRVSFHPMGIFLISCSDDHKINVFDLEKKKILYTLKKHKHCIGDVRFSHGNGNLFASSDYDSFVVLWESNLFIRKNYSREDEEDRTNFFKEYVNSQEYEEEIASKIQILQNNVIFVPKVLLIFTI